MNCPYCNKRIDAFTGLQELQKFEKHLRKCRKNPANAKVPVIAAVPDNPTTAQAALVVRTVRRKQTMADALEIRAESGQ